MEIAFGKLVFERLTQAEIRFGEEGNCGIKTQGRYASKAEI